MGTPLDRVASRVWTSEQTEGKESALYYRLPADISHITYQYWQNDLNLSLLNWILEER